MIRAVKLKELSTLFLSLIFLLLLIAYPSVSISGAKDGINLALYVVFPSIFPFMVLSKYLIYSGGFFKITRFFDPIAVKLFKIPKMSSVAFLLGIVSGYPVGASSVSDLVKHGIINKNDGEVMLGFCNNCSPVFIIGTVGTIMLNSKTAGYILCIVHIITSIIIAFASRNKFSYSVNKNKLLYKITNNPFTEAVKESSNSIISVCAYIVFFSVITKMLYTFMSSTNEILIYTVSGLAEISNGIEMLSNISFNPALKLSIVSFLLGFSGICVLFQTSGVITGSNMKLNKYLVCKFNYAFISSVLTYLAFKIFKPSVTAFAGTTSSFYNYPDYIIALFLCSVLIFIVSIKIISGNKCR